MAYDSYSRLVEYTHGVDEDEKTKKLYYDPLGRAFRREILNYEGKIDEVTHYYYKGSELVQEFDEMLVEGQMKYPKDDILWDYMRANSGKVLRRRYVRDIEEQVYADYFHWNDAQGTAKDAASEDEESSCRARVRDNQGNTGISKVVGYRTHECKSLVGVSLYSVQFKEDVQVLG